MERRKNEIIVLSCLIGAVLGTIIGVICCKPAQFSDEDIIVFQDLAEKIFAMNKEEFEDFSESNKNDLKVIRYEDKVKLVVENKGEITYNLSNGTHEIKNTFWRVNVVADALIIASITTMITTIILEVRTKKQ